MEIFHCEICEFIKHHRVSFPLKNPKILSPFSLKHSNVLGPSHVTDTFGSQWFVTFMGDCTQTTWAYLMKSKSEVSFIFSLPSTNSLALDLG